MVIMIFVPFTISGLRNEACKIIHGKTVVIQTQI